MRADADRRRTRFWPFAASVLCCCMGCENPPSSSVTATGKVSVNGMPLSGAVLTLEPISPTTGPNVSVPVFDGKFEVAATAGLHGGMYRVRVAMIPAEIRRAIPADQVGRLPADDVMIAPEFDADSKLSCELKPNAENSLVFAVEYLK